jgi:hypothetical protein
MLLWAGSGTDWNSFTWTGSVARQTPSDIPGELRFEPRQMHLGKIRQFGTQPFTFHLTNPTSQTLEIAELSASCGCTEVRTDITRIPPGHRAILTGALAAQDRVGEFGSTLQITFQDGRTVQAQVGGKAVAILHGPTHLDLGETFLEETPSLKKFIFKSGDEDTPWDTMLVKTVTGLEPTLSRRGHTWELSVHAPNETELGSFQGRLTLECRQTGISEPVAIVPVSLAWRTRSRLIEITPMAVYLGVMKSGQEITRRLRIQHANGQRVSLRKFEPSEGLRAEARIIGNPNDTQGQSLEVLTQSLPQGGAQSPQLRLTLETDESEWVARINIFGEQNNKEQTQ